MKVVVSPGHTADFVGVHKNKQEEYTVCKRITSYLKDIPYIVEVDAPIMEKVRLINELDPLFAIEVHLGNSQPQNYGTKSFYMIKSEESKMLADNIGRSVAKSLRNNNWKSYPGWYKKVTARQVREGLAKVTWNPHMELFLSETHCVSAQIEPFYLSNPDEVAKFCNEVIYRRIAYAIKDGIESSLKLLDYD